MIEGSQRQFASSNPIIAWATLVGGVSFLIGYIGPLLFSDSNLGPLLGIFVTGPLGFLAGALTGILVSARQKAPQAATKELRWLGGAWLGALLFTLAISAGGIRWVSLGAQLLVVVCAAVLFYLMPVQLPERVRKTRSIILFGAALVLTSSIFPPVDSVSGRHPPFALFLDKRFDASTRVPEYSVDSVNLLLSWLIIITAVFVVVLASRGSAARPSS